VIREETMGLTSLELCAGAGGQAVGLETAGFEHRALVENDPDCCETLRLNRPFWQVVEADIQNFKAGAHEGVDLLAGGLPCPPFSIAGKKLGAKDERNLFPAALRIIEQTKPRAVMIENVRGFLEAIFEDLLNSRCCSLQIHGLRWGAGLPAIRSDYSSGYLAEGRMR
jgi:DNA (cytosine-5)-methyltransferase 1